MGVVTSIKRFIERRGASINDPNHWLPRLITKIYGSSGIYVSEEQAMQVAPVYACVRVLSEAIASLPLFLYRRLPDEGGKEPATDHWLYPILHDSPNDTQTGFEFFERMVTDICRFGNFYGYKTFDGLDRIISIEPLIPNNMIVRRENMLRVYEYRHEDGRQEVFPAKYIWHVPGPLWDGLVGESMVKSASNAIGMYRGAESYGQAFFENYAAIGTVLSHPGQLSEPAKANLENSLKLYAQNKRHGSLVLEEGMKLDTGGPTNENSQYLELREYQLAEVARFFRVPAVLIGLPDKTMTYASAEQFFLSFVVHTVRPWLTRIEKSAWKNLLPEKDQATYFPEFKVDALLRGDIKSRYESYGIARTNKWMTANEIRALENMNPIDGGDDLENPAIDPKAKASPGEDKEETPNADPKQK